MFFSQKDAMLREYQSEIEKLKQMIEKGGFEGGEVVPSEVKFRTQLILNIWLQKTTQDLQFKDLRIMIAHL